MILPGETESGHCGDATMPKDGGLIETMNGGGGIASALLQNPHRIGRPRCLENPRPKGGILTNGERPRSISGSTSSLLIVDFWLHRICP